MENRDAHLFRVIFMPNFFVLYLFFTGVISAPVNTRTITEIMKNDTKLCEISKLLYDSTYTRSCASVAYPTVPWNITSDLNIYLCLGVYDTAYKICQYSSQLQNNSTETFNISYVDKFVPKENEIQQQEFCNNLQGFTSLYEKTDLLWRPLVEKLNIPRKCLKICFDFDDKFQPLCAIFAWIKSIGDNIARLKKSETKYDPMTSDKPLMSQSNDKRITDKIILNEAGKTSGVKETEEQNIKIITTDLKNNNNVKETNLNMPENTQITDVKPDAEKTKSDVEKANKAPKKANNTSSEIHAHKSVLPVSGRNKENKIDTKSETNAEVTKNIPANSGPQDPSINNAASNVPNKNVINEGNAEESNKEQDIDDLKTSTLSENTQDHYDAGNAEGDMETNIGDNIDDIDDTIQQPIDTGNQNENMQETIEQKDNMRYSNIRTEDDSHFFTYFTVITVACIAGYIGYHNKQKILAIVLEGRRSRSNRGRRRPSTASYRKLDCTLEEAVTSQCNANVTHVIY